MKINFAVSGIRLLMFGFLVAFCSMARGQIYVATYPGDVGEYTAAGATVNSTLISGLGGPWGMTWDGNNTIYIAQEGSRSVGAYTLSGTPINSSLISVPGDPMGVALDGAGHIFVYDALLNTVGEYTTSGTAINTSLITGVPGGGFGSIVCDGSGHLFVANSGTGNVSEYSTSGTLLNASFISASDVYAMAYRNGDLFLTHDGMVGEYTTSGATVNASLISGGLPREFGIALDGQGNIFVSNYVGNSNTGYISEYTISGTPINTSLVTGLFEPMGIVAVPEPSVPILALFSVALLISRPKIKWLRVFAA